MATLVLWVYVIANPVVIANTYRPFFSNPILVLPYRWIAFAQSFVLTLFPATLLLSGFRRHHQDIRATLQCSRLRPEK